MSRVRLALCQVNPTVGDMAGNLRRMTAFALEAERAGAAVAVFPEMAITGYPAEDLLLSSGFMARAARACRDLARIAADMVLIFGAPLCLGDAGNAAVVACRGRVAAVYRKRLLPNYGVFDEQRYFRAGERNLIFPLAGFGVGLSICEDIWYPDGPAAREAAAGATLLVNISASPITWARARPGSACSRCGPPTPGPSWPIAISSAARTNWSSTAEAWRFPQPASLWPGGPRFARI
jgi:NAD+ synthase (glutamine-hydrolysing)